MAFTVQFLGAGSAFTVPQFTKDTSLDLNICDFQSNVLVRSDSGKYLMLDCGSDARFSLAQLGLRFADIDGIYISHLHADHTGGLEGAAFSTFFLQPQKRIKLFASTSVVAPLWQQSLRGGLDSIEGRRMDLTGYFDVHRVVKNGHFVWEEIRFDLIQVVHVMAERTIKHSYGLMMYQLGSAGPKIFFTSDTQFCPNQIHRFYEDADLILHDCETAPIAFKSGVHAHYEELRTLDLAIKNKMWLYHYQPGGPEIRLASEDGFAGFVKKHQVFIVDTMVETYPALAA